MSTRHRKSGAHHLQFTNTPESPETTQASQRPQQETYNFHLHALDNKSPPSGERQSFFPAPRGPATVTCYKLVASKIEVITRIMGDEWVIGILSLFLSFFHSFGWRGRRWLRLRWSFFPLSSRRSLSSFFIKKIYIYIYHRKKEGSENKFNEKSPKDKCTCQDSNLRHRFT